MPRTLDRSPLRSSLFSRLARALGLATLLVVGLAVTSSEARANATNVKKSGASQDAKAKPKASPKPKPKASAKAAPSPQRGPRSLGPKPEAAPKHEAPRNGKDGADKDDGRKPARAKARA